MRNMISPLLAREEFHSLQVAENLLPALHVSAALGRANVISAPALPMLHP